MKIYIVEDDRVLRTELMKLLNSYGYECAYSDDWQNIIQLALQESPDLILLDINLPLFDGFHICREIRKQSDVPIELTKNEMKILSVLLKNAGKIVSRDELMDELWQSDEFVDDNTLTVNVNRLRKKLENIGAKDFIATKRGMGYLI